MGKQATTGTHAGARSGQSGKRGVVEGRRGVVAGRGVMAGQRGVVAGDTHFDDDSVWFSCAVLVFCTRDVASVCSIECE